MKSETSKIERGLISNWKNKLEEKKWVKDKREFLLAA